MSDKPMSSRERLQALANQTAIPAQSGPDLVGDTVRGQNDRDVKTERTRQRGVFNGQNKKLDVLTKLDGYHLHWLNDVPGRIQKATAGGYEFVLDGEVNMSESNKVVEKNSDVGGKIRAIVGSTDNNEPLYAYLMKIRDEWYDEDQAELLNKVRDSEAQMTRTNGLNTERIGATYVPDDRKQALSISRGEFKRAMG